MCAHFHVSRGGFYAWLHRMPAARDLNDHALRERIVAIHRASLDIYGSPRVSAALRLDGLRVGRRRVARLMRSAQLVGRSARLYRRSRVAQRKFFTSIPNRERSLHLERADQVWVADITYLRVRGQWRYLAVVMDKFSRRILGWSLGPQRDAALTRQALFQALRKRQPLAGLVLHTDRGIEYSAHVYRNTLARLGYVQSMNRPRHMNDNAHMESFFHSLKTEYLYGKTFDTDSQLRQTLRTYFHFYNNSRLHSSLSDMPPATFELSRPNNPCVN